MAETDDLDLLLAAGRGDREAFGRLAERHHRAVVRYVYRFLGRVDLAGAEDIAQDVFLSAWKACPSFTPRAKVLTWLLQIATNACLNHRRAMRLRRMFSLNDGDLARAGTEARPTGTEARPTDAGVRSDRAATVREPSSSPNRAATVRERSSGAGGSDDDTVRDAIASLPDAQRAVIILRHYHEMNYTDIAASLDLSVAAVESLLFRARRKLRAILEPSMESHAAPQVSPGWGSTPS